MPAKGARMTVWSTRAGPGARSPPAPAPTPAGRPRRRRRCVSAAVCAWSSSVGGDDAFLGEAGDAAELAAGALGVGAGLLALRLGGLELAAGEGDLRLEHTLASSRSRTSPFSTRLPLAVGDLHGPAADLGGDLGAAARLDRPRAGVGHRLLDLSACPRPRLHLDRLRLEHRRAQREATTATRASTTPIRINQSPHSGITLSPALTLSRLAGDDGSGRGVSCSARSWCPSISPRKTKRRSRPLWRSPRGNEDAEITLLHVIETIEHVEFDEMEDFYRGLETRAAAKLLGLEERCREAG